MTRVPSERVVRVQLANYETLLKVPQCKGIMDEALVQFGRDNIFDLPTFLHHLLHKCATHDMDYTFRWIMAYMLRHKNKHPFSEQELTAKHGVIAECRWARRYKLYLLNEYPAVFRDLPKSAVEAQSDATASAISTVNVRAIANACILNPLLLHQTLEGPDRKATLLRSLPNNATQMLLVHAQEIDQRVFSPEIKGSLSCEKVEFKYSPQKFLQADRPKHRFLNNFMIEYKKLELVQLRPIDDSAEEPLHPSLDSSAAPVEDGSVASANPSPLTAEEKLAGVKREVEAHIDTVLASRVVCLTKDGRHGELVASVASTDLYKHLESENARFVGIYDIKNAKLAGVYEGTSCFQREPYLDAQDFTEFLDTWHKLAKPSVDLLWVLCGQYETSFDLVKSCLRAKDALHYKTFFFNYNYAQMHKYYWKQCRGIANSNSFEPVLLVWKGSLPKYLPTERFYVDQGSRMYCNVMNKVPICKPSELAWVPKDVRLRTLTKLIGPSKPVATAKASGAEAVTTNVTNAVEEVVASDAIDTGELRMHVKKRKLYRHAADATQIWFPFEMTVQVAQELVWQSGGNHVKWVLHGSPGAGNVVLGSAQGGLLTGAC